MNRIVIPALTFLFFTAACESGPDYNELYRLNKQYWDAADYENAVYKINGTAPDQKKPSYGVPEKAQIFQKLVDKQNLQVVAEDDALGLKHRAEFASRIFDVYRMMVDAYSNLDREDKYVYPQELVDILKFGLYLQVHYFELGNQEMLQSADDPNDVGIQSTVKQNIQTLVGNYTIYLDYVKREKSFPAETVKSYADGINEYFPALIDAYPNANYTQMRSKAEDMLNKAESPDLKTALTNLIAKIDANKAAVGAAKVLPDSASVK